MKFRLNDFNLQFDSQETEEFRFNLNFILACNIHTVHACAHLSNFSYDSLTFLMYNVYPVLHVHVHAFWYRVTVVKSSFQLATNVGSSYKSVCSSLVLLMKPDLEQPLGISVVH